jgi:hypothetical protein
VLLDAPGSTVGTSEEFASREAAEDWMGATWRKLLADGALAATLSEDEHELYTMKLTED